MIWNISDIKIWLLVDNYQYVLYEIFLCCIFLASAHVGFTCIPYIAMCIYCMVGKMLHPLNDYFLQTQSVLVTILLGGNSSGFTYSPFGDRRVVPLYEIYVQLSLSLELSNILVSLHNSLIPLLWTTSAALSSCMFHA